MMGLIRKAVNTKREKLKRRKLRRNNVIVSKDLVSVV